MQEVATAHEVGQHSDDEDVIDGQYGDAYQLLEEGKMSVGTCQVHVCSFLKQFFCSFVLHDCFKNIWFTILCPKLSIVLMTSEINLLTEN